MLKTLQWLRLWTLFNIHCIKNMRIWNFSGPYFPAFRLKRRDTEYLSVFRSNSGKYRPEILRIRTLLTQLLPVPIVCPIKNLKQLSNIETLNMTLNVTLDNEKFCVMRLPEWMFDIHILREFSSYLAFTYFRFEFKNWFAIWFFFRKVKEVIY